MYDLIVKTIDLTADEVELIKSALEYKQDMAVSTSEILTIETLLEKLT